MAIDLSITLGLPVIIMALCKSVKALNNGLLSWRWKLGIIVQPYRFEIDEEQGCTTTSFSFVTYLIYYAPQLVLNLIAAVLARKQSLRWSFG